jgi:hypothetical protein
MHPYEYDPVEMGVYRAHVPLKQRLHQGIGRKGFPRKIDRLLADFRFGAMDDLLRPLLESLA